MGPYWEGVGWDVGIGHGNGHGFGYGLGQGSLRRFGVRLRHHRARGCEEIPQPQHGLPLHRLAAVQQPLDVGQGAGGRVRLNLKRRRGGIGLNLLQGPGAEDCGSGVGAGLQAAIGLLEEKSRPTAALGRRQDIQARQGKVVPALELAEGVIHCSLLVRQHGLESGRVPALHGLQWGAERVQKTLVEDREFLLDGAVGVFSVQCTGAARRRLVGEMVAQPREPFAVGPLEIVPTRGGRRTADAVELAEALGGLHEHGPGHGFGGGGKVTASHGVLPSGAVSIMPRRS
jgi:hypothetical protein